MISGMRKRATTGGDIFSLRGIYLRKNGGVKVERVIWDVKKYRESSGKLKDIWEYCFDEQIFDFDLLENYVLREIPEWVNTLKYANGRKSMLTFLANQRERYNYDNEFCGSEIEDFDDNPLVCLDNGEMFGSVYDAAKWLKIKRRQSVVDCCKGVISDVKGYHFLYMADLELGDLWLTRMLKAQNLHCAIHRVEQGMTNYLTIVNKVLIVFTWMPELSQHEKLDENGRLSKEHDDLFSYAVNYAYVNAKSIVDSDEEGGSVLAVGVSGTYQNHRITPVLLKSRDRYIRFDDVDSFDVFNSKNIYTYMAKAIFE